MKRSWMAGAALVVAVVLMAMGSAKADGQKLLSQENLKKTRSAVKTSGGLDDLMVDGRHTLNHSAVAIMQCLAAVTHDRGWEWLAAELQQCGVSGEACSFAAEKYTEIWPLSLFQNRIVEACGGVNAASEVADFLYAVLADDCDYHGFSSDEQDGGDE